MRVLWIISVLVPDHKKCFNVNVDNFGNWIHNLIVSLKQSGFLDNNSLHIISAYSGLKAQYKHFDGIDYYLVPHKNLNFVDKNFENIVDNIVSKISPDIIEVFGVEVFLINCVIEKRNVIPLVASLHGFASVIAKEYFSGISLLNIIKYRTLIDNLKLNGVLERKILLYVRGYNEIRNLRKLNYVMGRTSFDKNYSFKINSNLSYWKCNSLLNNCYFESIWDLNNVNRYSLYISQGHYPIKGLHFLIEAIKILRSKFPQISLVISGVKFNYSPFSKRIFRAGGYENYIISKIYKYKLQDSIRFVGYLTQDEILETMLTSHILVSPSAIENSPTNVAEGQMLGMPVVATDVGGTIEYINNNFDGLLVEFGDVEELVEAISKIFSDDKFAINLGSNAKITASNRHNPRLVIDTMINIYKRIISDFKSVTK